jgi:SAM-dependent methyltransferase
MIHDKLDIKKYKNNPLFNYYENEYEEYYPGLGIKESKEKAINCAEILDRKFDSVVDIGCGPGVFLKEFIKVAKIKKAAGTDLSMFILKVAQKQNPKLNFYRADSENLPFKDKEFELSTIIDVIEHIEHPEKMINEAKRVSKYVLLKVPLEDCLFMNFQKKFRKVDWKKIMGHINFYNPKSIEKFMEKHGFELIKYKIPKSKLSLKGSPGMILLSLTQWIFNILPNWIRTKLIITEYVALYKTNN